MVESVDERQLERRRVCIDQCDKLTGEAIVVQLCRLLVKQYRHGVELFHQSFLQEKTLFLTDLGAGPSIPEKSHVVLRESFEPCHQSTAGRTELKSVVRDASDAYW
jgi:hypothetical protein